MRGKLSFNIILILFSTAIFSCGNKKAKPNADDFYDAPNNYSKNQNAEQYHNVPEPDDFYKSPTGLQVVDTLEARFTTDLLQLKQEVEAAHAKLYICYITSENGEAITQCEKKEKPFLKNLCQKNQLNFVDFSDVLTNVPGTTFMPIDGHFNAKGSAIVANKIVTLINSNTTYRSDVTYPISSRPHLLGDEDTSVDKIVEDKPGLPYKLVTNQQGLRMDRPVEFPKTKQHILLLGDSEIYGVGIDNPETITGILQKKYPDKTIVNGSKWAYTVDDELSQWQQRTKYTEPDIVILQVDGVDITNLYFSQKLRFHRTANNKPFNPTPLEKKYYDSNFN